MARDSDAKDFWQSSILVYRKMPNGSLVWIGTVQSKRAAYELIKTHAKQPGDEFSIRRLASLDLTHVRAEDSRRKSGSPVPHGLGNVRFRKAKAQRSAPGL